MICADCRRDMVKVPRGQQPPPGLVRFHGNGCCVSCVNRRYYARTKGHNPAETVESNRRHLEAWLHERRARGVPVDGLVDA